MLCEGSQGHNLRVLSNPREAVDFEQLVIYTTVGKASATDASSPKLPTLLVWPNRYIRVVLKRLLLSQLYYSRLISGRAVCSITIELPGTRPQIRTGHSLKQPVPSHLQS